MAAKDRNIDSNRAVIYIRVSTKDQADDGISIQEQEQVGREYCSCWGFDVAAVIVDPGVTTKIPLPRRRGGSELISLLAAREADHVVVRSLSRAFRNAEELLHWSNRWYDTGIAFHSVTERITNYHRDPASRAFLTMIGAIDQMLRELRSEDAREFSEFKRTRGERYTSQVYGLRVVGDNRIEPDEGEQNAIDLMAILRRNGATLKQIADDLNRRGIPAKRGGRWHDETVRRTLNRRVTQAG